MSDENTNGYCEAYRERDNGENEYAAKLTDPFGGTHVVDQHLGQPFSESQKPEWKDQAPRSEPADGLEQLGRLWSYRDRGRSQS